MPEEEEELSQEEFEAFEDFVRQLLMMGLLQEYDECIAATRDGIAAAGVVLATVTSHLAKDDEAQEIVNKVGHLLAELSLELDEECSDLHLASIKANDDEAG